MSFLFLDRDKICDKDFVFLQIVLQKTEIMNQGKTVFAQIMVAHTKKTHHSNILAAETLSI